MHVHHRENEWFCVTEGDLTFWVGGRVIHASANAIEKGKFDPSLPLAFWAARLFGLPIEEIFLDEAAGGPPLEG